MMYLICIKFSNDGRPSYVKANESNWEQIFNPNFATQFDDLEATKDWVKGRVNVADYASVVEASQAIEEHDEWVRGPMVHRSCQYFCDEMNVVYDPEKHDKAFVLDWRIKYRTSQSADDLVSEDVWESYPRLDDIFKCLLEVECYGEDAITTFSMAIYPETELKDFKEELDLVIDKVTYKFKGDSLIHILDDEGNVDDLAVKHDGSFAIDSFKGSLEKVFNDWKKIVYD